jgi:hypothetical protein
MAQASARQVSAGSGWRCQPPDGPLGLKNPDGSLGHLTLPRGLALAEDGTLFLIPTDDPTRVLHYDVQENAFLPLPGIGGAGKDARNIRSADNLAIAGKQGSQFLYIADSGNDRIQVFHLASLALLHLFRLDGWDPIDVAAWDDWAFILFRHGERLGFIVTTFPARNRNSCEGHLPARWRRIAGSRSHLFIERYDVENVRLMSLYRSGHDKYEHLYRLARNIQRCKAVSDRRCTGVIVRSDPRGSSYHRGIFI